MLGRNAAACSGVQRARGQGRADERVRAAAGCRKEVVVQQWALAGLVEQIGTVRQLRDRYLRVAVEAGIAARRPLVRGILGRVAKAVLLRCQGGIYFCFGVVATVVDVERRIGAVRQVVRVGAGDVLVDQAVA